MTSENTYQMSKTAYKNFTHFICEVSVCLFQRKDLFERFEGTSPPKVFTASYLQSELGL